MYGIMTKSNNKWDKMWEETFETIEELKDYLNEEYVCSELQDQTILICEIKPTMKVVIPPYFFDLERI